MADASAAPTMTAPPAASGPTALSARAIAPDIARGAMLLLIALANAPWYLWGGTAGLTSAHPIDPQGADAVAQFVTIVAADGRTYPMFAFLFGYGLWQLYAKQLATTDRREARRLLRRRHLWMLAFGFVHAALLWMGDIIGAYGLAGLVMTWLFIDRRDVTLKVWAFVLIGLLGLASLLSMLGGIGLAASGIDLSVISAGTEAGAMSQPDPIADPNYLTSILGRAGFWVFITVGQGLLMLTVPIAILVAFIAARHRVLEEPTAHLRRLRVWAVSGIAIGWGVGLVSALQQLGLGLPAEVSWAFAPVQFLSGLACGLGYVAVFGLIAARLERRSATPGPVLRALRATGQRSMTCYLLQSVAFAPIMSAWGLGLGGTFSSWSIALFAIATWLVTVGVAVALDRAGRRGPAEVLLRKLVYRPAR